ncbi:MAG: hypothetical protein AB7S56_09335 [Halothiobacillaceae bacterium]
MKPSIDSSRLLFLSRVANKEAEYLQFTDQQLFRAPFAPETVAVLAAQPELAERVDAFVSRFGRLQDTLGDKLLPALLNALGEPVGAALDNLARAERLGWIEQAEQWMTMRNLRNKMVHEYIEDPAVLADALNAGHHFVPTLLATTKAMQHEIHRRGWQ